MVLSIIIAAYNCEKYIQECVESIFSQCDSSIEVIIINDGSTDSTCDILNFLRKKYDFYLIDQDNHGVAFTRNLGLSVAKGDYITFLDSDDKWEYNTFNIIRKAIRSNADCLVFNYRELRCGRIEYKIKNVNTDACTLDIKKMIADQSLWYLWRMVFKREIYKGVNFDNGRRFEDQLLLPELVNSSKIVRMYNDSIVQYRININSITNNLMLSDLDDSLFGLNKYVNIYLKNKRDRDFMARVISNLYLSHISKCARLFNVDKEKSLDFYRKGNSAFPFEASFIAKNKKAIMYFLLRYPLFYRLIKSIKNEV